jgi:S-adenosylmethionine decarboxylase proenzyme
MTHVFGMLEGNVIIKKESELVPLMDRVVKRLKLNEVGRAFHQFEPEGVTGVIVLSESHFSAHTYPEDDRVYVDLFCCSKNFSPEEAASVISEEFGCEMFMWEYVKRITSSS